MRGLRATAALAALLGAVPSFPADPARAAGKPSPAEIAAHRQGILTAMLTDEYPPDMIAGLRQVCASGRAPASVAEDWRDGTYFTPEAADECVTALKRTARDGHLPDLYRDILAGMGGRVEGYADWPRLIGAAVMDGAAKVPIGNQKVADVTPALAFDAGFTVAYQDGRAARAATTDAATLKALAESCLGQHQDAGTCFSAGYVYGAQAFRQRAAAAD